MPLDPVEVANDINAVKTQLENEFENFFASGGTTPVEKYEVAIGIGETIGILSYPARTSPKPTLAVQCPPGEPVIGAHLLGDPGPEDLTVEMDTAPEVAGYKVYVWL